MNNSIVGQILVCSTLEKKKTLHDLSPKLDISIQGEAEYSNLLGCKFTSLKELKAIRLPHFWPISFSGQACSPTEVTTNCTAIKAGIADNIGPK